MKLHTLLVAIALTLCGCQFRTPDAKPTAGPRETAPIANALGNAADANTAAGNASNDVDARTAKRDGEILADANAAAHANESNPDGVPKEQVDSHLEVLRARLKGAVENAEARAAAAERDKLLEQGKAAEARAATDAAVKKAESNAGELAVAKDNERKAREAEATAIKAAQAAKATLDATLEQNKKDNQASIDAAIAKVRDEERKKRDRMVNWVLIALGVAGALVAGATMYLTKGKEWERAAIAAGCSAACFTLLWAMGQWWFKWILWSAVAGMVAAVWWYLWRESRQHKQEVILKERSAQADEAEVTLKIITGVVDDLGENATVKDVRGELSKRMNGNHKALLHELKAEDQRAA